MTIVTLGVDLAKNVIALNGIDEAGKPALVCQSVVCGELPKVAALMATIGPGKEFKCGVSNWPRGCAWRRAQPRFDEQRACKARRS